MADTEKKEKKEKKEGSVVNKILILIILILLVVAGAGAVYLFTFKNEPQNQQVNNNVQTNIVQEAEFIDLGDVFVNLSDPKGDRYLKTKVSILIDAKNKKLKEEIDKALPQIKDTTLYYFKSKKAEDFTASKETDLKKGLLQSINKKITQGQIADVCFQELIVQ